MHFVTALYIVTLHCDNSVHCVIALHQRHSELVCLSVECAFLPVNRHFLQQFARKTTKFTALDKGNKINSPRQKLDTWRLICTRAAANCTRIDCKCDLLQLRVHHTLTSWSQEISASVSRSISLKKSQSRSQEILVSVSRNLGLDLGVKKSQSQDYSVAKKSFCALALGSVL